MTSSSAPKPLPAATLAPIVTIDALRNIEATHANEGLMERAGRAGAEVAHTMLDDRPGPVVVLAGPGNNGGDAFVVARWLRAQFHDVVTVFAGAREKLPRDAAAALAALQGAGGTTVEAPPDLRPALIVDGLFGVGLRRAPGNAHAILIDWANRSDAPILALDVPSGLDAATGKAFAPVIRADATATFVALKAGLLTGDGVDVCGTISIHPLGVELADADPAGRWLQWNGLSATLPAVLRRDRRNVNKGTFGTLSIIGGAEGMVGAPLLAGRAAMKLGAGKVRVGYLAREHPAVDVAAPELMLSDAASVIESAECLLVGPGLGMSDAAADVLARASSGSQPLVLDADALNLIAKQSALRSSIRQRAAPTLATPHPGEAARILGVTTAAVEANRVAAAQQIAHELNAAVVLKGAGSVLAYPDGRFDINGSGGPALATAGSGDVLAGMLAALIVQRIDPFDALRCAVCLHGAAADALVAQGSGPVGLVASELADAARILVNSS